MSKLIRKISLAILSVAFICISVFGVYTSLLVSADGLNVTATNAQILAGIYANSNSRTYTLENDGTLATFSAHYGNSLTDENDFDVFHDNCFTHVANDRYTWIATASNQYYCWKVGEPSQMVYIKAEIAQDAYLSLTHPAVENQMGDFSWSRIVVSLVRGGKTYTISDRERGASPTAENALLSDVGNVKAGDIVYVAVVANEWGAEVRFDPVFTFTEKQKTDFGTTTLSGSAALAEMANSDSRVADVYNESYEQLATIGAYYGTIGKVETEFDRYDGACSLANGAYCIDAGSAWYSDDKATSFYKVTALTDCTLQLKNNAFRHGNYYHWSKINITQITKEGYRISLVSTDKLSDEEEGSEGRSFAEGELFQVTVQLFAGDSVYVEGIGNEWGSQIETDPIFVFTAPEERLAGETEVSASTIIPELAANETHTATVYDGLRQTLATVTALYGKAGENENQFDSYTSNACSVADGKYQLGTDVEWYSDEQASVFFKFEILADCNIQLYNRAFTHDGYYNWTSVALSKASSGTVTRIFSTGAVNPNAEGGGAVSYAEGGFYDNIYVAKAGDVLYFEVLGNEWGSSITFDPAFAFSAYDPAAVTYESVSIGTMLYNVAQAKGGVIKNTLTAYTVTTGTITKAVAFNSFNSNKLAYSAGNGASEKAYVTTEEMKVDSGYSVIYRVDILSDCDFRFTHKATARGTWADGYTKVQIYCDQGSGAQLLRETRVSTFALPENYYCPDTYQAKAGETYYFLYRTSDSYYGAYSLSVGYEAGELSQIPETERASVSTLFDGTGTSGVLYDVTFFERDVASGTAEPLYVENGSVLSQNGTSAGTDGLKVASGKQLLIAIEAKQNIKLTLSNIGSAELLLDCGKAGKLSSYLAKGDSLTLIYGECKQTDWELSFLADRSNYVSGARITAATSESYDLFDMLIQQSMYGDEVNQRALSEFRLLSGKLYGEQKLLICSDFGDAKATNPDSTQYTGVRTIWYDPLSYKGTKILADNGYDTIIEVTATENALVSLTHAAMDMEQWALNTYVKALVRDVDGTTVLLYDKVVTKSYDSAYFAAEVNLKAGQSLIIDYYTPSTSYGAVDFLPIFTFDTEKFDGDKAVDFDAARELKNYSDEQAAKLQAVYDGLTESDYSGTSWISIENYLSAGKNKISEAADRETIDQILAEYTALISSVKTIEQTADELNAVKQEKIAELKALYESYNQSDYQADTWSKLTQIYENGVKTIQNQVNETKVQNAFLTVKTAMEGVEKDGSSNGCGSTANAAQWLILSGAILWIIAAKKRAKRIG